MNTYRLLVANENRRPTSSSARAGHDFRNLSTLPGSGTLLSNSVAQNKDKRRHYWKKLYHVECGWKI